MSEPMDSAWRITHLSKDEWWDMLTAKNPAYTREKFEREWNEVVKRDFRVIVRGNFS